MNITTIDLDVEILDAVQRIGSEQQKEVLTESDRLKHASLTREAYRKEAMRQIQTALATFK